MSWKNFTEIETWHLARALTKQVFDLMNMKPLRTDYALKDQMNRSSGSIMDNIAEGYGRNGNKEFSHFLSISKGSCSELQSQLFRCLDRNYITQEQFN